MEKGRKKGGSVASVAESEKKEELKAEVVKVASSLNVSESKSESRKG